MSSVVIAEKSHFTRHRTRRLTRREKWPLHLAFILVYFLIHLITSSTTSPLDSGNLVSNTTTSTIAATIKSSQLNPNQLENEKEKNEDKDKGLPPKDQVKGNNLNENTKSQGNGKEDENKESEKSKENEKDDKKEKGKENTEPDRKDKEDKKERIESISGKTPNSTTEPSITSTTVLPEHSVTVRPKRINCSAPAIEQFPRPLMGPSARKHGGLIIHVIVAVYTFLGLAIVCDDYFVSSLDRICEELRLSPDVAGATFMAAGSSAPELATVVIGVFFAQDDIGVSGVIGSAVFNIMFVISVCGLCTTTVSKLNWWPLCRDSFFYAVSILVMLGTIFNEIISWPEALFMLIMYVVYCVTLSYNASLERWAKSYNLPFLPKDEEPAEQSALVTYKSLQEERVSYTAPSSPTPVDPWKNPVESAMQAWDDEPQQAQQIQQHEPIQQQPQPQQQQPQQQPQQVVPAAAKPQYYKAKEYDPNEISPLEKPVDGTQWQIFSWALVYPIHYTCRFTMPDVRQEKYKRLYPYTFLMSMLWISFYSYIMVWMITIIGSTLGIPDTVMGLTFVAAGVSVPDALSSLAVIKEGLGDMAVSNAVGSNVFDILVCLGLPWFIQTAIIKPGSHVNVTSRGLTYSTLSLLSTVVFLVIATHMNGWKLDRRYGIVLMVWYLIFIVFASLYELNVFGQMNPPVCPSIY